MGSVQRIGQDPRERSEIEVLRKTLGEIRGTLDVRGADSNGIGEVPREVEQASGEPARIADRLGALERRVDDLAGAGLSLAEYVTSQRAEAEGAFRRAELRVAEAEHKLKRKQRRHELKLARQERDRKIQRAERRLGERAEQVLATIEREGKITEERVQAVRAEATHELESIAGGSSVRLKARTLELGDTERRLVDLIELLSAAAERVRSADERALAAEQRVLEIARATGS